MKKIFKFTKRRSVDLSNNPEAYCEAIQCGKMKFTMQDYVHQFGHDDSIPYSGILCLNGEPLCRCTNDGWGGMTDITPIASNVEEIEEIIKENYKWSYGTISFDLSLDFIADTLACTADLKCNKV